MPVFALVDKEYDLRGPQIFFSEKLLYVSNLSGSDAGDLSTEGTLH